MGSRVWRVARLVSISHCRIPNFPCFSVQLYHLIISHYDLKAVVLLNATRKQQQHQTAEREFHVARHILPADALAMPKRDQNQQAARAVKKITGSEPARGEDLVRARG
jgi:hypothetical protein